MSSPALTNVYVICIIYFFFRIGYNDSFSIVLARNAVSQLDFRVKPLFQFMFGFLYF